MTGERQLRVGREDPDVVTALADRGDEGGLREADLPGEHGHRRRVESHGRIRNDTELVPRERDLGEHVDEPERDLHGGEYPSC